MKNFIYAISTIKDVLRYNDHESLNGAVLDRIEQELSILEEIEDNGYTEEEFEKFYKDLLNLNVTLLPTSEKAIKKFGE